MRKNMNRFLAIVLVMVMVCGLLPQTFIPVHAEQSAYKFSYDMLSATEDKQAIAEGSIAEAPFFSVIGKVTKRWKEEKGVTSVEVEKACKGAIAFTIAGEADVKIEVSSTGGSNTSLIALYNAADEAVANKEGITEVSGTGKTTLTYALQAGTYRVVSPVSETYNRGARVFSIEVTAQQAAATAKEYGFQANTLTAAADKEELAEGNLTEDGFFTVSGSITKRIDKNTGAVKSIELAKKSGGAISFTLTGSADVVVEMASTGSSNVSKVALVDASGETVSNKEGLTEVVGSSPATKLTYALEAGTYRITAPGSDRGARVFSIKVTETAGGTVERPSWESVALPAVTKVEQRQDVLKVTVDMPIGKDGADSIVVSMMDENNKVLVSETYTTEGTVHELSFVPATSGCFVFTVTAKRIDEANKVMPEGVTSEFVLPLKTPVVNLIHQGANGALTAIWSETEEATSYEVTLTAPNGTTTVKTTSDRQYTFEGLTVGQTYSITVAAIRGEERTEASAAAKATATAEAQTDWGFTAYGPSTNTKNNDYKINEDGTVTVWSENGKGKIQPSGADGIAFYYTAIPTDRNFTFRVNVHVDQWTQNNGQEGFGLLATDSLGIHGDGSQFWTNQYMLGLTKVEYRWDSDENTAYASDSGLGDIKMSMKLGLGVLSKTGLAKQSLGYASGLAAGMVSKTLTMESASGEKAYESGTYNIVGNCTTEVSNSLMQLTDFVLEIEKNNTGYFLSYYDQNGNLIHREKNYDPDALSALDSEFVYVGYFASRYARATFKLEQLDIRDPAGDPPAEEKPKEQVTPVVYVSSAATAQSTKYEMKFMCNVAGSAFIRVNDKDTDLKNISVKANQIVTVPVDIVADAETKVSVYVSPDPNQDLGEGKELSGTGTVSGEVVVIHTSAFENRENLYVAPNGYSTGDGSLKKPLDIYTAISVARPGQTIILLEGTYKLETTVRIERGINGTAEKPIRMIGDPSANTRPVLDFQGACAGIVHGGNHWFFYGFDVTNTQDAKKGFQVSGNSNILDNIVAHHNGDTGIQISRLNGSTDLTIENWPVNNLIRNCTSYANMDKGYENADGFAAKLTCGEGNVFDGCVAYNNADDGWDLYAKNETGQIGAVTIKNCVAYANGYLEDGTSAGNGNGFKMGGESISGKHKLVNSISFNNRAKGIDSNSCPDIIVENCISYNNGSYNVAFYTKDARNTAFKANGIISFKDDQCSAVSTGENLKPVGTQNEADYLNDTCYFWNGTASKNTAGAAVEADAFVSFEFKEITRNEDGTINMQGFLELTDKAPANAGARLTGNGTPSEKVTVNNPDKTDEPDQNTDPTQPSTTAPATEPGDLVPEPTAKGSDPVVIAIAVVLGLAVIAAVVVLYLMKKKEK